MPAGSVVGDDELSLPCRLGGGHRQGAVLSPPLPFTNWGSGGPEIERHFFPSSLQTLEQSQAWSLGPVAPTPASFPPLPYGNF